tara:strand:+ start:369 stop:998 length:630 start_codon:yes stop_codon:yes gene_type:complete
MPPKINFKVVKKVEKKPKFKVVKKVEEPKKKPIKFNVKKEAQSIGKSLTGLSKAEMNKLSVLELFGKLPTELRKKIVNPKETGVIVGMRAVPSFTYEEIVEQRYLNGDSLLDEAYENLTESGDVDISWVKGITPKMAKFYADNVFKYQDLNKKEKARMDKIEDKYRENVNSSLSREIQNDFKQWKKENRLKKMTEKQAVESFASYSNIR